MSRSWTTRPQRPGEPDDAYVFVDRDTFMERAEAGDFLEWVELPANHHLYGTPWPRPDADSDVILEIELQGAAQVLERHPEAVLILVVAPSPEVQAERMRARGDDEEHIAARLALGAVEEPVGRRLARRVVVNDDLDRAVTELAGIVDAYRTSGRAPGDE